MAKRKVYAELATFNSMVDAQSRYLERKADAQLSHSGERVESEILWDSAHVNSNIIQAQQVKVCEVPEQLQALGFESTFVYDRTHFENHMLSDDYTHGHDGTPEQLKMLPEVLSHPIAIVTTSPDVDKDQDWRPLTFLYADPSDKNELGYQNFKMAVVSPVEHYGGALECGTASKVITYFDTDFRKFDAILASTQPRDGRPARQELLYFDRERWDKLPEAVKGAIPETQKSVARPIEGHYSSQADISRQHMRHMRTLKQSIYNEMSRYAEKSFDMYDTRHSPTVRAIEIVGSANATPQDLMLARKIFEKSAELCPDKALTYKALDRFSQAYDAKMIEFVKQALESVQIQNEGDLDKLWDMCDELKQLMMNPGPDWGDVTGDIVTEKEEQFYDSQQDLEPIALDGFDEADIEAQATANFSQCEDLTTYMEELESVELEFGDI